MNNCLKCGKPAKNKYCSIQCCNKHLNSLKAKKLNSKEIRDKGVQTKHKKWTSFIVNCHKCKKEIVIKEYNVNTPKKEKYFCSRGCANSRRFSKESNKKRSESLKRETNNKWKESHTKICKECNSKFKTYYKWKEYCSKGCKMKSNHIKWNKTSKEKIRNIVLNQYKNGKKIYGGTTKWFNYKDIKVQGTYELRTCFILDKWKEEEKIKYWEYTNDRIEYIGIDNKRHTYLLDFKVFENNKSFYYQN